ncbi:nicotinate-nucleotide--dimethylbenzimidazole phosphoribosyltransferase [Frisingicoccus sp.]|uniref:nicotinate-nucleotide--dimethylbenzimidazole phosphoribosyltransferase n=1 Tax=Frisingicoccus sp. TaxID=1918627 RepID=UPI00399BC931
MLSLEEICGRIRPADAQIMHQVWKIWDNKCIPLRSLDWLQETFVRIAGVRRTTAPCIDRKLTIVMAADNGVIAEGVSQSDYHVTTQVVENMLHRRATIALMSERAGSDFLVADIGMKEKVEGVLDISQMRGTYNMAEGPSMSRETAIAAIEAGADVAMKKASEGYQLLSTGEMGIGNTTSSSAVLAVLSGKPVSYVTGRGAGLSSEGLERKIQTIEKAVALNRPNPKDVIDILAKVGGLDIAGLTGVFLGAAASGVPVVIDGFIASVAALLAKQLAPAASDGMIASHCSKEPGAVLALEMLGLKPVIYGDFHLGEGSGAVFLFPMLDQAFYLYEKLPSFEEGKIETYIPLK